MLNPPPPPAGGVGSYNHHCIGEEDGVEASVVLCQSLRPPRPCHLENLPKMHKMRTKNERTVRARCSARCARCTCFSQGPYLCCLE